SGLRTLRFFEDMLSDTGRTDSLWMLSEQLRTPPPLREDLRTDVCVIGAGIAGVTTAYLLAKAGKRVVVLDDGPLGGGETGRTTAHLSNALDDRYHVLERLHGSEGARLAAASHGAAIDRVEAIVREESIDCDFRRLDGYLFVPPGDSIDILEAELEAARRAGLVEVALIPRAPLQSFDTGPCLRFPRQGQFHPLSYLNGLIAALERMGGRAYGDTHVTGVEAGPPAQVATESKRTVTADFVVCATNTPVIDWLVIHSKQAAYRTYVIGGPISGEIPTALFWDTADPYHYVRLAGDILIVGGEDHKTGQEDDGQDRFGRLERWTKDRFPIRSVEFRWSGQVMEPVDALGYIGRNPGDKAHVFVATGDSGHGMTHGTIAGILISDLILGRSNEWEKLYDPGRKSLKSTGEYLKVNLNVAKQYTDYVTPGEVRSEDEIRPGQGAIVRHGLKKLAVYRDESGALHRVSAVCTHLGCIVHWNSLERSWDCPCHGSRFGIEGKVLNGPALGELQVE
ncbi:MAG TPA: FAD-dependent oxidoreductase, partial [Gemmatimonadales bacterium]|nr:FAD-dependent oxidoreductase [Gemmatimonadales bacterium]